MPACQKRASDFITDGGESLCALLGIEIRTPERAVNTFNLRAIFLTRETQFKVRNTQLNYLNSKPQIHVHWNSGSLPSLPESGLPLSTAIKIKGQELFSLKTFYKPLFVHETHIPQPQWIPCNCSGIKLYSDYKCFLYRHTCKKAYF